VSKKIITENGETKPSGPENYFGPVFDVMHIMGRGTSTVCDWKERKGDWDSPETCFWMVKWPARACMHLPLNSQSWVRRSSFPRESKQAPAPFHKLQSGKKMEKCHTNLKDVLLGYV